MLAFCLVQASLCGVGKGPVSLFTDKCIKLLSLLKFNYGTPKDGLTLAECAEYTQSEGESFFYMRKRLLPPQDLRCVPFSLKPAAGGNLGAQLTSCGGSDAFKLDFYGL